eukprot:279812-Rhodomonas_salina.4
MLTLLRFCFGERHHLRRRVQTPTSKMAEIDPDVPAVAQDVGHAEIRFRQRKRGQICIASRPCAEVGSRRRMRFAQSLNHRVETLDVSTPVSGIDGQGLNHTQLRSPQA